MANRKPTPQRLPEAVREAVERTLQATREGAETTRTRAQDAGDELVRGAEAGAGGGPGRGRGAGGGGPPAPPPDIQDPRQEPRAAARRPAPTADRRRAGA